MGEIICVYCHCQKSHIKIVWHNSYWIQCHMLWLVHASLIISYLLMCEWVFAYSRDLLERNCCSLWDPCYQLVLCNSFRLELLKCERVCFCLLHMEWFQKIWKLEHRNRKHMTSQCCCCNRRVEQLRLQFSDLLNHFLVSLRLFCS